MIRHRAQRTAERLPAPLHHSARVLGRTGWLFYTDSCTTYAAAIAYYAVFSLVPLAVIVVSILGLVVEKQEIVNFIFEQIPLRQTPDVEKQVNDLVGHALGFRWAGLSIGAVTLVWSASGVFGGVRRGLNAATHTKRSRPFWQSKLMDFALIPTLGGLLILGVWVSSAVERLTEIEPLNIEWSLAVRTVTFLTAASITFALFVLLYRYVPVPRHGWPEAATGAAFATVAFELSKQLWAWAVARVVGWDSAAIYAGLGYAAGIMLWVYINAIVLLLGAEFGRAVTQEWRDTRKGASVPASAIPASSARRALVSPETDTHL
ncbi:MAG TPA: YihY/virulence factor BrkB family protein [Tepidiformaceae bacterium]|nr:YihY/virulence factor BrkB family protein [Tepidiformaceae bacterium]